MKKIFYAFIFLFFSICIPGASVYGSNERYLYWDRIIVNAYLDGKGRLNIEEIQSYVFNGFWNGGERIFHIKTGERFIFSGISRYEEATGEYINLTEGDIDQVDHYKWPETKTLRWRSRLESDPPFDNTRITYSVKYAFENMLTMEDGKYILDFNFLFPDRDGTVLQYKLNLQLHKDWSCIYGNSLNYREKDMAPGRGYPVKLELGYSGAGTPSVRSPVTDKQKSVGIICALCVFIFFAARSIRCDYLRGRFKPVPVIDKVDEEYLNRNLFYLLPEEVGALWDETIGAPEVAAILARLVSEKKLESSLVRSSKPWPFSMRKILRLRLLVPADSFKDYEKKLIKGLFFSGRKETDTEAIKKYYKKKSKAFDPKSEITPGLLMKIKEFGKFKDIKIGKGEYVPGLVFFLCFVLVLVFSGLYYGFEYISIPLITGMLMLFLAFVPAFLLINFITGKGFAHPVRMPLSIILLAGFPFIALLIAVSAVEEIYICQYAACILISLTLSVSLTVLNRTENSSEKLEFRRTLASIRDYFIKELYSENPKLKDEWFPYLVAFGLAGHLDKWGRRYGISASGLSSHSHSGSAVSAGGYSFTGGGGAFGGAGATGAWIAATGAMASAASSSSSGGSGGGGSSGGGGGGGW